MIFLRINAQCVDSIESSVDCCTTIDIYSVCGTDTTLLGAIFTDSIDVVCGGNCFAALGTTSGPTTKPILYKTMACTIGPYNLADWCNLNPTCTLMFHFKTVSSNSPIPCNMNPGNVMVTSTSDQVNFNVDPNCCCGKPFHAEIINGKLKYWYDCP